MWNKFVAFSEDKEQVVAKLSPDITVDNNFDTRGLSEALSEIGAGELFVLEDEVTRFINFAKEMKSEAYVGIAIAEVRDATVEVVLSEHDMLASMVVTGAYKGKPLKGPQIVHALAQAHVTKGINKLALKKVLVMSHQLKAGETFTQAVAKGKNPTQGVDAKFVPLVEDPTKQVLAPKASDEDGKVDMLNLGETITVAENDPLMKRLPATKGKPGITVQGKIIPPKPGNDSVLKAGKGTKVSPDNPNLLIAEVSGMPILKERGVDVEDALCLPTIGVSTGHVKFKGNVVVFGNIESDMVVRTTGSLTVGGFIESADVQAQGDIEVAKGIIGHNVSEDEKKSCVVKSGGSITANYAQFSELQAANDITLAVHCMSNELRCGHNLVVCDANEKQGTLSGGSAKVGGKVTCVNLGVEGDTATHVHAFARFQMFKDRQAKLKEQYTQAQEVTMDMVRKELEFKKIPKSERTPEQEEQLEADKSSANAHLEKVKNVRDTHEQELEVALEESIIEVKNKVYTHVMVQFGEEKVTTKRVHGPSIFNFNQFEIKFSSMLEEEDVGQEV
ncbi:FapA family protein [Vibrio europaeus]|uniref:FapA family protein n=1 Tax=Vibrio europaeus TaxID=300876 RepID=A0A178J7I5_9VIBR|nr:FapA family protein [Vibrio europaeus]MDC5705666.1 FapA family protein [Vibrio europaeus]MDC5710945.1 FapA family protein [Vibrio europaeus]MDC5716035.1 FapA family protein [Vibrio europaeus]MDC5720195.1 FapA family protein [Vibrio europaeus]MDC5723916.1 FapA family protein [Vibrio europaeus]